MACFASAAVPLRYGQAPEPGLGGPIDLVDQDGTAFHLKSLAGRGALVFFGYTHCGTTCPAAMVAAREVLAESHVEPAIVFITLDPLNDPPAQLRSYVRAFDPRIIGLTGVPGAVMRVAERYGVGVQRDSWAIGHSAMWYLLDRSGRLVRVYSPKTPAAQLASDLDAIGQGHNEEAP